MNYERQESNNVQLERSKNEARLSAVRNLRILGDKEEYDGKEPLLAGNLAHRLVADAMCDLSFDLDHGSSIYENNKPMYDGARKIIDQFRDETRIPSENPLDPEAFVFFTTYLSFTFYQETEQSIEDVSCRVQPCSPLYDIRRFYLACKNKIEKETNN